MHSHLIQVEVDISQGLPCFQIVGLPGSEVREARERVKVALKNVGVKLPPMCINVNLSPADLPKNGTMFDLPVAVGIMIALGKLEQEAEAYGMLGLDDKVVDPVELPFSTVGAVRMQRQAQFHPLRFLAGIAGGLNIFEHSFVTQLLPGKALTKEGSIAYQKVIFATHFPVDNKHGWYFLKLYQHRSYVIALEQAAQLKGMYVDEAKKGMSFRGYKDLLLVGGGSHRTGKKGGNWQELRDFAERYYPRAVERYHWAAQDCMPLDEAPYIGVYSPAMPECYVATGFRKWGITSAMVSAMVLTDLVQGIENPYAELFHPARSIWTKQLACNGAEAVLNMLTPTVPRCPHLGCALKWNRAEHSWDCPCHGSRFSEEGELLDNPAAGGLKKIARKGN